MPGAVAVAGPGDTTFDRDPSVRRSVGGRGVRRCVRRRSSSPTIRCRDVLSVPVTALVALAEGGYAVAGGRRLGDGLAPRRGRGGALRRRAGRDHRRRASRQATRSWCRHEREPADLHSGAVSSDRRGAAPHRRVEDLPGRSAHHRADRRRTGHPVWRVRRHRRPVRVGEVHDAQHHRHPGPAHHRRGLGRRATTPRSSRTSSSPPSGPARSASCSSSSSSSTA